MSFHNRKFSSCYRLMINKSTPCEIGFVHLCPTYWKEWKIECQKWTSVPWGHWAQTSDLFIPWIKVWHHRLVVCWGDRSTVDTWRTFLEDKQSHLTGNRAKQYVNCFFKHLMVSIKTYQVTAWGRHSIIYDIHCKSQQWRWFSISQNRVFLSDRRNSAIWNVRFSFTLNVAVLVLWSVVLVVPKHYG